MGCKVLFTTAAFVPPGTKLGVVGSTPELGSWDCTKAVCLTPQQECYSALVPTAFCGVVEFSGGDYPCEKNIRFKFIRWRDDEFRRSPEARRSPMMGMEDLPEDDFRLPAKAKEDISLKREFGKPIFSESDLALKIRIDSNLTAPSDLCVVQWEGQGPHEDRFILRMSDAGSGSKLNCGSMHVMRGDYFYEHEQLGRIYLLPCYDFLEPMTGKGAHDQSSEYHRTTRYYFRVRDAHRIHFQRVIRGIYVGSCPRAIKHLQLLRDDYNVGIVFNLQTFEDIQRNWIDDANKDRKHDLERLQEIYNQEQISLVHLPTEDMSTPARASLMAQTAALIALAVVANPNRAIYIHCNAGVGRAVATACSFLRFVLGLSEAHTATLVKTTRTVAYLDLVAMNAGLADFTTKYKPAIAHLPILPKSTSSSTSKSKTTDFSDTKTRTHNLAPGGTGDAPLITPA